MDSDSLTVNSAIDGMATLDISDSRAHVKLAADIAARCNSLLTEVEEFQSHLREQKRENLVDVKGFKYDLESELKRVKNLPLEDSKKSIQYLNCTNLPFLEALWSTAKRTTGIKSLVSIGKRMIYKVPEQLHGQYPEVSTNSLAANVCEKSRSEKVVSTVDLVAMNGSEWIKVSTITERKMLFDLAKSGWAEGDSSGDEDFEEEGLMKIAVNLVKVAKSVRVRYRNPTVRIVLPRIRIRECHKEVVKILHKIKDLGVALETAEDIPRKHVTVSQARDRMTPDPFDRLSDTLNVDTTILLALASDLSHDSVESKDWHHSMISFQIKMEKEDHLLPSVLWPVCGARKLVCTREAADRALEIIGIIATETERKRMALLLDVDAETSELTREQRVHKFQQLSKYLVPLDWCLPIKVLDVQLEDIKSKLPCPSAVEKVSKVLRGINPSVFFFGWQSGYTTITSNRGVAKDIEKTIEKHRIAEEVGPNIWMAPASRSLVGKEKERRGAIPEDTV